MTGPGNVSFSLAVPRIFSERIGAVVLIICIALLVHPAAAVIIDRNTPLDPAGDSVTLPVSGRTGAVTLPSVTPNNTPGFFTRQYTFSFQQENITIGTNVSAALYYGAKNGDKFATILPEESPETLAPDYYRAFVNDPAQDTLYADLLRSFRAIRQEHRYTDDEYLELLTVFVQSLPYDNTSGAQPDTLSRFPAETIVDGIGDCDDKSVLLAGLLSRERYNVSLLLFIPEHHMAIGVESDCLQYNNTGYMYVETTGISFMGDVPKRLNQPEKYVTDGQEPGTTPLTSTPVVIRVGSGSGNYSKAGETVFILAQKYRIDARIASLKVQINTTSRENPSRFRRLLETYNAFAEVHNYIGKHRYDRAGTYRYLVSVTPPVSPVQHSYTAAPVTPSAPLVPPGTSEYRPAGDCIISPSLADDPYAAGYLPCPRGLRVSGDCIWQSVRQELVFHPAECSGFPAG
jgi:hypothetical protein